MATHQHATIEDTVYTWFGSNNTSGSGNDGASPLFDVRLAGAAASAIPVLSGSATLLTHANFPAGAHEVAIAATDANGFIAGNTYAIFVTLLVDSQNPTGFAGSFTLAPIISDMVEIHGSALTETAGQLAAAFTKLFDVATPTLVASDVMVGTDSAALASVLGAAVGASISADIAAVKAETVLIVEDTGTTLPARFTSIEGATFATGTDSLEAIRNQGDAEWTSATGFATEAKQDAMQIDINSIGSDVGTIDGKIGTPANIDTGGATLADNLKKLADDNNGVDFDATTDSQQAIRDRGDAAWTPATGFATEAKQDAGDVVRDRITDIQEADRTIDFTAGTLIYETKGTATVLLTKNLKDPAGAAVNSTEDVIAAEENV